MNKNKKAFYTAIFGNYLPIDNPKQFEKIDGWDYFLFTNINPSFFYTSWNIINIDKTYTCNILNARNIKWNGHPLLNDYDTLIWMDPYLEFNIQKISEFNKLLSKYSHIDIIFKKHPFRSCIYEECNTVIQLNKDNSINVNKNRDIFLSEKMPYHYGLIETNFIIYNNNKTVKDFFNKVFLFMIDKSYRDQLSLTYNIWKHSFNNHIILNYSDIQQFILGKLPAHHNIRNYNM